MVPSGDEHPIEGDTPLIVGLGVSLLNPAPEYLLPLGIRAHTIRGISEKKMAYRSCTSMTHFDGTLDIREVSGRLI
jgi:hypothetical protein